MVLSREERIKQVVAILSASEEEDGYDYDTVDAKKAVVNLFSLIENGTVDEIAEFMYDRGLVTGGV